MSEFYMITNPGLKAGPSIGALGTAADGPFPGSSGAIDVFNYEDYRAFMRDRFAELRARRPAFSQRGLARNARIANPGFFNEVIKGRRRLSHAAASKMAIGLELSPRESEYFSALVHYSEARDPVSKLRAGKRMVALRNRQLYHVLHADPSLAETLREIVRELERDWVLQAAGLSVDQDGQDGRGTILAPMSEAALSGILEKLVSVRSQADATPDSRVVQLSLRAALRAERTIP